LADRFLAINQSLQANSVIKIQKNITTTSFSQLIISDRPGISLDLSFCVKSGIWNNRHCIHIWLHLSGRGILKCHAM